MKKLLEDNPALQDVAIGVLDNPRYSVGSVEGLADTTLGAIKSIDGKAISKIPGLNKVPLDVINANNLSALFKGDLFGTLDLPYGEQELIARNTLSGFTRGKKFTPTPCNAQESKTDNCSHIELTDKKGTSLDGKQFVKGASQTGKGGWGFLKNVGNGGYEKVGLAPWGVSAKTHNLKLVINKIEETGGTQTTTASGFRVATESGYAEFGLTFGICIKSLFIDTCTSSFIDLPLEFIPKELIDFKVAERGRVLIATTSPAPKIPRRLRRKYRRQLGLPGDDYCDVPPTQAKNETYADVDPKDLVQVGTYHDRPEFIHKDLAPIWEQMKADAAKDGVNLGIASGVRTTEQQQSIWDYKRDELNQTDDQIAKVNTRPGYSEHHTGWVIDIVDRDNPSTDFNNGFRDTKAGQWLARNAAKYNFEKSYPHEDNNGIQREEWHWRYVGSEKAKLALNLGGGHSDGDGHNHDGNSAITSIGSNAWGPSRDRANLLMTSVFEASGTQNQTDVAVSIMNRVVSSRFPGNATDVTFAPKQYEPNFGRSPVGSKGEAISRIARYKFGGNVAAARQEYERLEQSLSNPNNIISAQNHIGGATDFRGFTPQTRYVSGDPYRGNPSNPNGKANFFVQGISFR